MTASATGFLFDPEAQLGSMLLGGEPSLGGFMEATSGIIAHWRFDEASGTIAHDKRGTHDGTYAGSPTFGNSGPSSPCVSFGSSSEFMSSSGIIQGTSSQSVEVWFRVASLPTSTNKGLLIGLYESSTKTDKCLYLTSDGKINFNINQSGTVKVASSASGSVQAGRWYHAVGVFGSNVATVYLNSTSVGTVSATSYVSTYASGNLYVGGGTADTYVAAPGKYNQAAVYNAALTVAQVQARWYEGVGRITGTNVLVTQAVTEVLRNSSGRQARITQSAVEVLRATGVGFTYGKSATTHFTAHASAGTASNIKTAAAASGITFSWVGGVQAVHTFEVEGASAFALDDIGSQVRNVHSVGSTGMTLAPDCRQVFDFAISAGSGISLSDLASGHRSRVSAASTGLTVSTVGSSVRHVPASATGGITLAQFSGEHALYSFRLSASSAITLGAAALYIPETTKLVESFSGVTVIAMATSGVARPKSALTRIHIGQVGLKRISPVLVSAGSNLTIGARGGYTVPGPRSVTAASQVVMSGSASLDLDMVVIVSASSGINLSSSMLMSFGVFVSASSSMRFSSARTRTGRVVRVSAETSMGVGCGDDSNDFFHLSLVTTIALNHWASVAVGYTPACNSFSMTDLAVARVKLPWRFKPLPLPPGGGLPHS